MEFRQIERVRPEFNVAPLIDVVLLLLFFFMISSTFVMEPGLHVELPGARMTALHEERELRVLLTENGDLYVQERRVEFEGLPAALEEALAGLRATAAQVLLVVKADRRVAHGAVVRVLDAARVLGIEKLAIATRLELPVPEQGAR